MADLKIKLISFTFLMFKMAILMEILMQVIFLVWMQRQVWA